MKRAVFKLGLFLVLGAVVNVAVAWSIARLPIREGVFVDEELEQTFASVWLPNRPIEFPDSFRPELSGKVHFPGCELFMLREGNVRREAAASYWKDGAWAIGTPPKNFVVGMYSLQWCRAGWPCRSLSGGEWTMDPSMRASASHITFDAMPTEGYSTNLPSLPGTLMPIRPIWPGFAANTIFYASICWLLVAAPFALRRRRRLKRGLCPHCKYPVGTSPVCTECGKPVKPKATEAVA